MLWGHSMLLTSFHLKAGPHIIPLQGSQLPYRISKHCFKGNRTLLMAQRCPLSSKIQTKARFNSIPFSLLRGGNNLKALCLADGF
jgi:hypothetical protein